MSANTLSKLIINPLYQNRHFITAPNPTNKSNSFIPVFYTTREAEGNKEIIV